MPTATYWLILWLISVPPTGTTNCMTEVTTKTTAGQYTSRAECEAAFTAAYGEGLANSSIKALHMCIKATSVMP